MPKVKKRSGKEEEFDRAKLERSLSQAGAKAETVRKVAETVKAREGITTAEMRNHIVKELKRHDPETAKRYEDFRK
jgi:transcriptional repressor NrdR